MSSADIAYTKIRMRLLQGEYLSGSLLSENVLADELQMSRTPIRDAIQRLTSEGYLMTLKNRGILVREIPLKEIYDMMEVLTIFQYQAITKAAEKHIDFPLDQLEHCLEEEKRGEANSDYYHYIVHSLQFIRVLISVIQNNAVMKIIDSYHDIIIFVSITNYRRTPHQPHFSSIPYHQEIINALIKKDYKLTNELCAKFFERIKYRMFELGY